MFYRDYIKSPLWEKRKELYFATHPKVCVVCKYPAVELHHLAYGEYGHEKDKNLAPLCRLHHQGLHDYVGVRKNTYYQSQHYIDTEREKYRTGNFVVVAKPAAKRSNTFESVIHAIAQPIRKLFDPIVKRLRR